MEIIDVSETHPLSRGKSGKRYGEKMTKYIRAIKPHIPWILEQLKDQDYIVINTDKMAERLGPTFLGLGHAAIYRGVQYVLWKYDIYVDRDRRGDGMYVLVVRKRQGTDRLPTATQDLVPGQRPTAPRH